MKISLLAVAALSVSALGGCASHPGTTETATATTTPPSTPASASTARQAQVNLASASGSLVSGKLTVVPKGDGVQVSGEIGGLAPGSTHGFHIHEKGDCSAVDASSAGGHFNPAASVHGKAEAGPHHAGDADNLVADAQGVARVDAHFGGVTLGGGAANDVAGRAVIVHAAADDYKSQPAGNAGARVACGVITVTF
jgi:Cu-Zn family superoxide dismutase